ncbi:tellurium resistance protein TerC [Kocuria flava]|uniref:Tellurium resistance protein TerC n=1 Tax=Kocuria flava TaxID=446860 RepID=A0A2N4T2U1_9MICC|nr:TerC family protein [Kocuria flava]PLC12523.1 tellurium resistance protein TerC [Kocuria flava]
MDVPVWGWAAVLAGIAAMLAVDLLAHRRPHAIAVREAAAWTAVWVACGTGFGVLVWALWGARAGQEYFSGYLVEKSLSVDNVFVWAVLLSWFAVPPRYQHRVLFLGVVGALVLRGAFIAAGAALIHAFEGALYIFAAFLLWTGWRMARQREAQLNPDQSTVLRLFRRVVPMTDAYYGQRLLVRIGGALRATPLLAVLVLVEATDLLFALDSIPAVFAVTDEPFLVFTANAFAVLGLRAMYFLLADLMHRFVHLRLGLAAVLVWVGVKMALKVHVVEIPTGPSLAVIAALVGTSVLTSLHATRGQGRRPAECPEHPPFRAASAAEVAAAEPLWRRPGR